MNKYIDKIKFIAFKNKYTKWYNNIIERALSRKIEGYVERHHILPKSFKLGGEKDKENVVKLTAREHFICHLLLSKMFSGKFKISCCYALFSMHRIQKRNQKIIFNSWEFKKIKEANNFARKNSPGTFTGKKHSEESKKLIRKNRKGKNKGQLAWNKNKNLTKDHKEKISQGLEKYRKENPQWIKKAFGGKGFGEHKRLLSIQKPTIVDGIKYPSATIAAEELGLKKITLIKRIKSQNFPNYRYIEG